MDAQGQSLFLAFNDIGQGIAGLQHGIIQTIGRLEGDGVFGNGVDILGQADEPVFNKIDAYQAEPFAEDDLETERTAKHYSLDEWKSTWMNKVGNNALFISALNKENLEDFKKRVYDEVREIHVTRFPYNHFLYQDYNEEGLVQ